MFESTTKTTGVLRRIRPLSSTTNDPYSVILPEFKVQIFPEENADVFVVEVNLDADCEDGGSFQFHVQSASEMKNDKNPPTVEYLIGLIQISIKQMNECFDEQAKALGFEFSGGDMMTFENITTTIEMSLTDYLQAEIDTVYSS